eukprot:TRINITY_DN9742_c0_g1_i1.p1 TRINITY_DN9742_c0_g1~~TRINITY_DN9742_c0_g1_i1.p1  ORF type:complete len:353 (+),score=-5.31 TRINITY_DN9742_c0_g1_i1:108-1166(+)
MVERNSLTLFWIFSVVLLAPGQHDALECSADDFGINYKNESLLVVSKTNQTCYCKHFATPGNITATVVAANTLQTQESIVSGRVIVDGVDLVARIAHLEATLASQGNSGPKYPESCLDYMYFGRSVGNGIYTVYPDRTVQSNISVYCDMETDGGGWTLIGRAGDTNGAGGDYEFSSATGGVHSILDRYYSFGNPVTSPQYLLALDRVLPRFRMQIDLQYYCYNSKNKTATTYWVKALDISVSYLKSMLATMPNPDFLLSNTQLVNMDGVVTPLGYYALMARNSPAGTVECWNAYAGQSGMKASCSLVGQAVMNPKSVWYLTHSAGTNYTEVTSCGSAAGNVMPLYWGEVRFR